MKKRIKSKKKSTMGPLVAFRLLPGEYALLSKLAAINDVKVAWLARGLYRMALSQETIESLEKRSVLSGFQSRYDTSAE